MKQITTRADGSIKVVTVNNQPSITDQQFAETCDINTIMKKYKQTGQISHISGKQGQYADFTQWKGYQNALQTTIDAQTAFMNLPSPIRNKFRNDPTELIQFLSNPSNREEAESLGLVNKRAPKINDDSNDKDNQEPKKTKQPKTPSPE